MNTYKNNPVRCAREFCAFYAVVLGGFCEECEGEAFPVSEAEWLAEMGERENMLGWLASE